MDSNDSMETPIEHIQNDEDEVAKMILSELEKQKREKDEIARLEKTLSAEERMPPQPQLQQIPVHIQPQPAVAPNHVEVAKIVPEDKTDIVNKDILIIAVLVFILSQPSIQNFFPKTNQIIRTLLVSGLVAGGFFLYKKGNF
jgi:hypothetical protein